MTYANIKLKQHVVRQSDGTEITPEPMIHEFIKPFVEALALKYPQWEFVEDSHRTSWSSNDIRGYDVDGFKVMDKREELGKISVDHWCRAGKRFFVDNFRIDAQKTRGRGFKTKHMDKAMKYVSKYFGAKDHSEMLNSAEERADYAKSSVLHSLQSEVRTHWRRLDDYAADYLMQNWEGFSKYVQDMGSAGDIEAVTKYPEAYLHHEEASKINALIDTHEAWLVHLVNSDYIVKHRGTVSILESDALPATVRRNLGLLKLVKDRELISNVGIRVSEDTFYVVGENNE